MSVRRVGGDAGDDLGVTQGQSQSTIISTIAGSDLPGRTRTLGGGPHKNGLKRGRDKDRDSRERCVVDEGFVKSRRTRTWRDREGCYSQAVLLCSCVVATPAVMVCAWQSLLQGL